MNFMSVQKRKRNVLLLTFGLFVLGLLLAFLFANGLSVGCVFNLLTGLNCPGCGNTRATFALLRFDLVEMLHYNLLYPLEVFYGARIYFILCRNYVKEGRIYYPVRPDALDVICLVSMLLWWVLRNLIPFVF